MFLFAKSGNPTGRKSHSLHIGPSVNTQFLSSIGLSERQYHFFSLVNPLSSPWSLLFFSCTLVSPLRKDPGCSPPASLRKKEGVQGWIPSILFASFLLQRLCLWSCSFYFSSYLRTETLLLLKSFPCKMNSMTCSLGFSPPAGPLSLACEQSRLFDL